MSRTASVRCVLAVQRDLRHRGLKHARTNRVTLGVIRVEQAVR